MSGQPGEVSVLDLGPAADDFCRDVIAGLSQRPRTLPCKYFYDERGAELFRQICELPEYYITRTELAILRDHAGEMADVLGLGVELIGLGTGAGTKTRLLLENLREPIAYLPIDISCEQLINSCAELSRNFPTVEMLPVCADYLQPLIVPTPMRQPQQIAVYFPGSTIGNFEPQQAQQFLARVTSICGKGGALLIGVDLKKDPAVIQRAYNDSAGVTAAFNLNLLVRANRELDANFDLTNWRHEAVYNAEQGRIEMYLISTAQQQVQIGSEMFDFANGEKITTEYSYKHAPEEFIGLASAAGFDFERIWSDPNRLFGVFLFRAR